MNILYFLVIYILIVIIVKQFFILKKTKEHYQDVNQNSNQTKDTNNDINKENELKQTENKLLSESEKKMEQIKKEMEDIQKKKKGTYKTLEDKEKDYQRNLDEQEKLEKAIKKLEKQRNREFELEYKEASKIEKEISSLKNEISQLKEKLETCNKEKDKQKNKKEKDEIPIIKLEKDREKPIIQNSVDRNLNGSQSVKNEMEYVVGCNKDSDCNVFFGEGKNVCKSNHQCHCEVGSGELCQYGPTKYKDPKDMTKKEKHIFKHLSNYDDFTIQDYKNWLGLYKKDYYLLSDEHLINLRKILRGEPIRLRDIPTSGIFPPDTSQRYFAEMYDKLTNAEKIVAPINSSTTGNQVGYNYMDYSDFSKPESLGQLRVINGEIERKYRRPSAKNKIWPTPLEDSLKKREDKSSGMPILLEDAIGPFQESPNI